MRLPRLIAVACFIALMAVTPRLYADDPAYTGASLVPPNGGNATVGTPFDISWDFTRTLGPDTDYVIVEIRDTTANKTLVYSTSSALKSNSPFLTTYDTARAGFVGNKPVLYNAGTYKVKAKAMKKGAGGAADYQLKSITGDITAAP